MPKKMKAELNANGHSIEVLSSGDENDYVSLTDIAKYKDSINPRFIIQNWMRNRNTIEFLGTWENLYNKNFKRVEFEAVKNESGLNSFVLTPQKWISSTDAIGIVSKSGRYGGTYAHKDIAFEFASWISAEFKLYIIKEYQRLKSDENSHLSLDWNVKRTLSKINYKVHTDAVKDNLITDSLSKKEIGITYANEADVLNMALFGVTAKEWKQSHKNIEGNIRDNASLHQLLVMVNLEAVNAEFIKQGLPQQERLIQLRRIAVEQMRKISSNPSVKGLTKQ
ncbi:KilA-N domain-containing protein [Pectinatus haikarae]|uniref:KilA-N domain-containing protein n=1 Tax=Pectinatus haikarae TaxID=349096 RepID=UPI0018C5D4A8|nr:KilA-N domain-containing protein [Pectinatus haikarae]